MENLRMDHQKSIAIVMRIGVTLAALICVNSVRAAEGDAKDNPGVVDQVGTAVKNAATRLEKEVTGIVKKLEDSETPKKVGNEIKRSAESLGQKVEETGKKLKQSFKSE